TGLSGWWGCLPVKEVEPSPIGRTVLLGLGSGVPERPPREPPARSGPSDPVRPPQPASETAAAAPAPSPSIPLRVRLRMASPIVTREGVHSVRGPRGRAGSPPNAEISQRTPRTGHGSAARLPHRPVRATPPGRSRRTPPSCHGGGTRTPAAPGCGDRGRTDGERAARPAACCLLPCDGSGAERLALALHRLGTGEQMGGHEVAGRLAVADRDDPVALVGERGQRGQRALPPARVVPQPPALDEGPHDPDRQLMADQHRLVAARRVPGRVQRAL